MNSINNFNESSLVKFDHFFGVGSGQIVKARFRLVGGTKTIDASGKYTDQYDVKVTDLEKRRRKLERQGINPTETEKAISLSGISEGMSPRW